MNNGIYKCVDDTKKNEIACLYVLCTFVDNSLD